MAKSKGFICGKHFFADNGDGNIEIISWDRETITIPLDTLVMFVAEVIRQEKADALAQMSADEVLGL